MNKEAVQSLARVSPPAAFAYVAQATVNGDMSAARAVLEIIHEPSIAENFVRSTEWMAQTALNLSDDFGRGIAWSSAKNTENFLRLLAVSLRPDLSYAERQDLLGYKDSADDGRHFPVIARDKPALDAVSRDLLTLALDKLKPFGEQIVLDFACHVAYCANDRQAAHHLMDALDGNSLMQPTLIYNRNRAPNIFSLAVRGGNRDFLHGLIDRASPELIDFVMGFRKESGFRLNFTSRAAMIPMDFYLSQYADLGAYHLERMFESVRSRHDVPQERFEAMVRGTRASMVKQYLGEDIRPKSMGPLRNVLPVDLEGKNLLERMLYPVNEDGSPGIAPLSEGLKLVNSAVVADDTSHLAYPREYFANSNSDFYPPATWKKVGENGFVSLAELALNNHAHEILSLIPNLLRLRIENGIKDAAVQLMHATPNFDNTEPLFDYERHPDPKSAYRHRLLKTFSALDGIMPLQEMKNEMLILCSRESKPALDFMFDLVRMGADPMAKDDRGWRVASSLKGENKEIWTNFANSHQAKSRLHDILQKNRAPQP